MGDSRIFKEVAIVNKTGISTEKRQSPRVETSIPVRYWARDGIYAESIGAQTIDMSTGGLRFGTDKPLSTIGRLMLELDIPTCAEPIKAVAKVAWIRQTNAGEECRYEVGSQFLEITEKNAGLIAWYLNRR